MTSARAHLVQARCRCLCGSLVSGAQLGVGLGGGWGEDTEEEEEKKTEGFVLYLRVPFSRGVMSNESCFAVHCYFVSLCSSVCKHA